MEEPVEGGWERKREDRVSEEGFLNKGPDQFETKGKSTCVATSKSIPECGLGGGGSKVDLTVWLRMCLPSAQTMPGA